MPGPNCSVVSRQPPPPEILAAAEQDYRAIRDDLAVLLPIVQALLSGSFTEVEVVTDVWLTLLLQEPRRAAFLGAAAIVQLATGPLTGAASYA